MEKNPCASRGTFYMDGSEMVLYISKRDGKDVCKCFECKTAFYVFDSMLISIE